MQHLRDGLLTVASKGFKLAVALQKRDVLRERCYGGREHGVPANQVGTMGKEIGRGKPHPYRGGED